MSARHAHDLRPFVHAHAFGDQAAPVRERALWWVTAVTLVTMVIELIAGYWSGSLALVADGWHMGTHALALGGAALAAALARRAHGNARFAFGGWKIEVLAAYSSGLLLLAVSLWIAIDAVSTLIAPRPIAYETAIGVALVGLLVNAVCAWLLSRGEQDAARRAQQGHGAHGHADAQAHGHSDGHGHVHGHARARGHAHGGHDHNFRAAYLHVLADALTSVLAIVALGGGLWLGWRWLDPAVALLGGVLIAQWAIGVLRDSARALVDASVQSPPLRDAIRATVESDGDARIADLHVWQVGPDAWSAALSVVADRPLDPATYHVRLAPMKSLRHVTIEVHQCRGGTTDGAAAESASATSPR